MEIEESDGWIIIWWFSFKAKYGMRGIDKGDKNWESC